MKYQNDKVYSGTFAGIECRFTLYNLSEKVIEEYNRRLVNEAKARISAESQRPVTN